MGDTFTMAAAEADYVAFEVNRKAQYVTDNGGDDGYEPITKDSFIIGAIDGRLDVERAAIVRMRQAE